jgi:hypothetical protein
VRAVFAAIALVSAVQAQPIQDASVAELVKQLAATATRGLRNLGPEKRLIDLVINFDFDSAKLQTSRQPFLEQLAEALCADQLQALPFMVDRHTECDGAITFIALAHGGKALKSEELSP